MDDIRTMAARSGARGEDAPRVNRPHLRLLCPVDSADTRPPVPLIFLDDRRERADTQSVTGIARIRMLAWCVRVVLPAIVAHWLGRLDRALASRARDAIPNAGTRAASLPDLSLF